MQLTLMGMIDHGEQGMISDTACLRFNSWGKKNVNKTST